MDNEEKKEPTSAPISSGGLAPPRKPSSNAKWYVVIVVLLVIASAFGVLAFYHPTAAQPAATELQAGLASAKTNQSATFYINATGSFKNVTVYYGDGTSQVINYNNNNTVVLHHTYMNPGNYYIMYTFNYGSSTSSGLVNVVVSNEVTNLNAAYRYVRVNPAASSTQFINNRSNIFTNDSHVATYLISNPYTYNFLNGVSSYMIVDQNYTLWHTNTSSSGKVMTTPVQSGEISYVYSPSSGVYQATTHDLVFTGLTYGLYQLEMNTTTGNVDPSMPISTTIVNTTMVNLTTGQSFVFVPNSMISANISGLNLLLSKTNLTVTSGTALNFTGATTLYATSTFTLNSTYMSSGATVTVTNETHASVAFTPGTPLNVSAGYTITTTGNVNFTFLMNASGETPAFGLNDTTTNLLISGNETTTAMGFNDATLASVQSSVNNISYAITLSGNNGAYDNYLGNYNTNTVLHTSYFQDFAVVPNAKQAATAGNQLLVNAELASGGPTTLDPQIGYFTVDSEVLQNTMQTLLMYNGTSVSSFLPQLATHVPSVSNGEINNNTATYTGVNQITGQPFGQVSLVPYQNYTFKVRANATWQDGTHVSAWDVYTTLVRDLLFMNASPGTGAFIFGEYYLPFPYASTGSFANITNNMTVDNSTNSITIHFQHAMTPQLVFQTLSQTSASYVVDAAWLAQHNDAITYSPAGFAAYAKTGNLGSYNTYVQENVMANGPYEVSYYLPGSEIVLTKNPDYVAPGPWYPAPSIANIVINWLASPTTQYLALKSGEAQIGNIPTSLWSEVQQMTSAGIMQQLNASPTLGIYFEAFNSWTNTTIAQNNGYQVNMPTHLFASVKVRKAFNYAFNLTNYLAYDVGNVTYNTPFGNAYQGMIPKGMSFFKSMSDLNATTNGQVPYYSIAMAKHYWNNFVNQTDYSSNFNMSGTHLTTGAVTWSNSLNEFLYNNHPLVINIFIPQGDPTDQAGMGGLAKILEDHVIIGATINVQVISYVQLYALFPIPTQNPMSLNWGGWAPDYPGPADYLLPMYLGTNTSTYMKPNGMEPWEIAPYNQSEANVLSSMIQEYQNGFNSSGTAQGAAFQQMNANGINLSLYITLYQTNAIPVISTALNGQVWLEYQSGVMTGANGVPMYNLAQYK